MIVNTFLQGHPTEAKPGPPLLDLAGVEAFIMS